MVSAPYRSEVQFVFRYHCHGKLVCPMPWILSEETSFSTLPEPIVLSHVRWFNSPLLVGNGGSLGEFGQ